MREPTDVGGFVMRDDCRSETKESISNEWTRPNECSVGGGSGVGLTDIVPTCFRPSACQWYNGMAKLKFHNVGFLKIWEYVFVVSDTRCRVNELCVHGRQV